MTVDAKQRHTFIFPDPEKEGRWKVCAEAAPDVFSANSTALAAALSNTAKEQAGEFGLSINETVAAIGRTQTVNTIRESMYRTCERFLSGATSRATLVVQAARDQRAMVALLAIEQLTGAQRTRTSIISGPAVAAAISNNERAVKLAERLDDQKGAAEETRNNAEAAFIKLDGGTEKPKSICGNGQLRPTISEGEAKVDGLEAAKKQQIISWVNCDIAKREYDRRESALVRAEAARQAALDASKMAGAAATSASGGVIQITGDPDSRPSGNDLASVAQTVQNIVNYEPIDETLMFCLGQFDEMKNGTERYKPLEDVLIPTCAAILQVKGAADIMRSNPKLTEQQVFSFLGVKGIARQENRLGIDGGGSPEVSVSEGQVDCENPRSIQIKFVCALHKKIGLTDRQNLVSRMEQFIFDAGLPMPPDLPVVCKEVSSCRKFAEEQNYYFAYGLMESEISELSEHLSKWKTP